VVAALLVLGAAALLVVALAAAAAFLWWHAFAPSPRFTGEEVAVAEAYWPEFGRRTVLLDPGHGCADPGAQRSWSLDEAEVNWEVAQAIRAQLEASGYYRVLLTREERDVGCQGVSPRGAQASRRDADLLVSIHANAGDDPRTRTRGTMLIWSPPRRPDESLRRKSEWLAVFLGAGLAERGFTLHCGGPLLSEVGTRSGATYVVTQPRYGVHLAGRSLGVLRSSRRPAVLVETHFLSTQEDAAEFQRSERYAAYAEAVELGLRSYFAWEEGRLPSKEALDHGFWTIQILADPDPAVATGERERLAAAGFEEARVEEHAVGAETWHRVRVGRFTDRAALGVVLHGLEEAGWEDLWVERVEEGG
jgi:N-acetylmuramoyl-L-alanine amidase